VWWGDARSGKQLFPTRTKKGTGKYPTTSVLVSVAWGREGKRALGRYHGGRHKRAERKYVPFFLAHVVQWGLAFG
jgi:hypothetical protein